MIIKLCITPCSFLLVASTSPARFYLWLQHPPARFYLWLQHPPSLLGSIQHRSSVYCRDMFYYNSQIDYLMVAEVMIFCHTELTILGTFTEIQWLNLFFWFFVFVFWFPFCHREIRTASYLLVLNPIPQFFCGALTELIIVSHRGSNLQHHHFQRSSQLNLNLTTRPQVHIYETFGLLIYINSSG